MPLELEVKVVVETAEAKAALAELDRGFDKTAASATKMATATTAAEVATKTATGTMDVFTVSVKESEEILQALGNTGPGVFTKIRGGLNEVAEAAGITTQGLGLMGAAGLALGVAYASWNIGRMIADFFDLDQKIGNATAKLLGWGDLNAQTAGAIQDVITRAEQSGIAFSQGATQAQKYAEAIKYNATVANQTTAAWKQLADSTTQWQAQLDRLGQVGKLDALKADLNQHVLSVKELAERYNITVHAVELYKDQLRDAIEMEKRSAAIRKQVQEETDRAWATQIKWIAEMNKETAELVDHQEKRRLEVNKAITAEFEKQVAAMAKAQAAGVVDEFNAKKANQAAQGFDVAGNRLDSPNAIGGPADVLAKTMAELNEQRARGIETSAREEKAMNDYIAAVTKANTSTDQMSESHGRASTAVEQFAGASVNAAGAAESAASALSRMSNIQVPTGESLDRAGIVASTITQGWVGNGGPIPWGGGRAPLPFGGARDSGGPVKAGTSYYVGSGAQPELFVPSTNGTMTPNGGGGVSIGGVTINGNVDSAATAEKYAQRTAEILYQKLRREGKMTLGRA